MSNAARSTSMSTYSLGRRLLLAVVPVVAAVTIRGLAATLRYETLCEADAVAGTPESEGVWCFWHQCLLTAACFFLNDFKATILISRSFDGELIARTIEKLGYSAARGSSSRAGVAGLRQMAVAARSGIPAVFPADGPRGPRYVLKPGAIKLGQMTGHPIGVFYLLPKRAWKLKSWDEFLIPQPFSRVVVSWSRTVTVTNSSDEVELEACRLQVQDALERARHLAERHFENGEKRA